MANRKYRENYLWAGCFSYTSNGETFYAFRGRPGVYILDGMNSILLDYFKGLRVETMWEWRKAIARLRRAAKMGVDFPGERIAGYSKREG